MANLKHFVHFSYNTPRVLRTLFRLEYLGENQMEQQVKSAEAVHVTQAGHSTNDAGFPTDLPSDRIFMRRVHVTPTRVLLFPATIETSNRVIRRWKEFQDNFLRVRSVQSAVNLSDYQILICYAVLEMRMANFVLTRSCNGATTMYV